MGVSFVLSVKALHNLSISWKHFLLFFVAPHSYSCCVILSLNSDFFLLMFIRIMALSSLCSSMFSSLTFWLNICLPEFLFSNIFYASWLYQSVVLVFLLTPTVSFIFFVMAWPIISNLCSIISNVSTFSRIAFNDFLVIFFLCGFFESKHIPLKGCFRFYIYFLGIIFILILVLTKKKIVVDIYSSNASHIFDVTINASVNRYVIYKLKRTLK